MHKVFLGIFGFVTAVLMAFLPARALANCDVLLDASGSMNGFDTALQYDRSYQEFLENLEARCEQFFSFGEKLERVSSLSEVVYDGQYTELGEGLSDWRELGSQAKTLIIVTDNVANSTDLESQAAMAQFYELMQKSDSPFSHAMILPVTFEFRGRVSAPVKVSSGPTYKRYPEGSGTAPRALAVYILTQRGGAGEFEDTVEFVTGVLDDANRDYEEIRTRPLFTNDVVQSDFDLVDVENEHDIVTRVQGVGDARTVFIENRRINVPYKGEFTVKVTPPDDWEVLSDDNYFFADVRFEDIDDDALSYISENFRTAISPGQAPVPAEGQDFTITFELDPIEYMSEVPFSEKLTRAFRQKTTVEGEMVIRWMVARDNLSFDRPRIRRWSYVGDPQELREPREDVQTKIYELDQLLKLTVSDRELGLDERSSSQSELKRIPISMELIYPTWPLLVAFLLLLLVLTTICVVLFMLGKPRRFLLNEDGAEREVTLGFGNKISLSNHGGDVVGSLRHIGVGFLVASPLKIKTGRILGKDGGEIRLQQKGAGSASAGNDRESIFASLKSFFSTGKRNEWDIEFDDSNYGEEGNYDMSSTENETGGHDYFEEIIINLTPFQADDDYGYDSLYS